MFNRIKTHYKKEQNESLKKSLDMIRHNWGEFVTSWAYNEKLTKRQKAKPIREQKALLIAKYKAETLKRIEDFNKEADEIAQADELKEIYINVSWSRSRVWGYNPHAEVWAGGYFVGSASGCGYDKLSSAIAQALNQSKPALKIIYKLYEKELKKNPQATPHTVAYGMGYNYPYYEGGVGYGCFQSIFKLAKAKTNEHRSTNTSDIMIVKF